jgi:two-component system, OmpR family, response regulator
MRQTAPWRRPRRVAGQGATGDMKTADTRVLVLDDDPFMCEALAIALGSEGYNVRTETDGTTINQSFSEFRPAVAVVDVNLGDGPDGFSVTRRLRAMSDLPVILVSASTSVEDRLSGFSVGGDDFLVKPFSMAEMLMRVEALLRRANHGTSSVIEVGDIRIDDRAHVATRAGKVLPLRNLEYKLLLTFCRHSGQVLSKAQLLDAVWGFALSDVNLVEVHVSHLRAKLEECGPRVIQTVRSVGYVLDPSSGIA